MKRKGGFDAIIVETTGLADPAPVAQTFFVDEDVKAKTRLDSVTAWSDASHVLMRLADSREAVEQIAFADQIVLNKTDTVDEAQLQRVETAIRRLNPLAPIHRAERSNVPLDAILGRGASIWNGWPTSSPRTRRMASRVMFTTITAGTITTMATITTPGMATIMPMIMPRRPGSAASPSPRSARSTVRR
jgi:G3E family GTPase